MADGKEISHTNSNESSQVGNRILLNYIEEIALHSPGKPVFCQLAESKDTSHDQSQSIVVSYRDLVNLINNICWQLKSIDIDLRCSSIFACVLSLKYPGYI